MLNSTNAANRCAFRILKRVSQLLFIAIFALLFTACEQQITSISNTKQSEKPVKFIQYLEEGQQADGVLVKFRSNTGNNSRARSLQSAGLIHSREFSLVSGLALAQTTNGLSINDTLLALSNDPNVAYAEPNYIFTIDVIPNDPNFSQQWGLNNNSDNDIDAPEAWDITTGSNTVVVAVIDSGVDYNHPELQNQMWTNPNEIAGNGRDDDNNGFVDDVRGWDFSSNDNDPMDEHNHGTHVAGIIGARGNNSRGGSGVNWNIRIMPVKFMNAQGAGSTSAAIQAIDYASRNGARISNNSWGGGSRSQALFDAIQSASTRAHLFVAASGNGDANGVAVDNDRTPHYPSSYLLANIIAVAATDQNDALTSFSNFGATSVDLAAPGLQIYSTIRNGQFASYSGTSMASPFVSGVAALLLSQNSSLTVNELKAAILDNVDRVGSLSGRVLTGGRLNAFTSVTGIPSSAPPAPVSPVSITQPAQTSLVVGNTIQLSATGGTGNYTWRSSAAGIANINANGLVTANSPGNADITVMDSSGLLSPPVRISVSNGGLAPPSPSPSPSPTPSPGTGLVILPANISQINLGDTLQMSVGGGIGPYAWTSSAPAIASIATNVSGSSASVSTNSNGSFQITINDSAGASISTGTISVISRGITLNASKTLMNLGETVQTTVTGGTSPYSWTSSNNSIVSVNTNGLVTALGNGVATVTVTDVTGARSSLNFEVVGAAPGLLTLSPAESVASINSKARLVASGGGLQLTWKSSNASVATVDSRGIVTAVSDGVVQISATDETGTTGTASFEVRTITIDAAVLTIGVGDTLQLSASGGQPPYTWESSNNSLATLDANGLLTTNSAGTTGGLLVTATDSDNIAKSIIITINSSTTLRAPRAF